MNRIENPGLPVLVMNPAPARKKKRKTMAARSRRKRNPTRGFAAFANFDHVRTTKAGRPRVEHLEGPRTATGGYYKSRKKKRRATKRKAAPRKRVAPRRKRKVIAVAKPRRRVKRRRGRIGGSSRHPRPLTRKYRGRRPLKRARRGKTRQHHKWRRVRGHVRRTNPSQSLSAALKMAGIVGLGALAGIAVGVGVDQLMTKIPSVSGKLTAVQEGYIRAAATVLAGLAISTRHPEVGVGAAAVGLVDIGRTVVTKVVPKLVFTGAGGADGTAVAGTSAMLSGLGSLGAVEARMLGALVAREDLNGIIDLGY